MARSSLAWPIVNHGKMRGILVRTSTSMLCRNLLAHQPCLHMHIAMHSQVKNET